MGYDCSGFVQMLFQERGILLKRDSGEQILDPRLESSCVDLLKTGDLLFFGKSEEVIQHVAFYLEKGFFIHATVQENKPWIRISHLQEMNWMTLEHSFYPYRIAKKWKTPLFPAMAC